MSLEVEIALERGALSLAVKLSVTRVLAVVGPNASGKSTLLRAILGVVPSRGRIALGDLALHDLPTEERGLGYVPQDYALFPHLSVRDNVGFGGPADEELARFELLPLAARRPATLSGGERQRVALARALAASPRALLLDEPLAALDVSARQKVRASLGETLRRLGLPALVVTHDPADACALADQIAVLEQGRVVQTGTAAELRSAPASPFVAELFPQGTA